MSTGWSAGEFRRVRMVAVVASTVTWMIWLGWGHPGYDSASTVVGTFAQTAMIACIVHFGVIFSLCAERWVLELRAAYLIILLPYLLLAGLCAALVADDFLNGIWTWSAPVRHPFLLALHVVQLWALTGIPFPRLAPLSGPQAAGTSELI